MVTVIHTDILAIRVKNKMEFFWKHWVGIWNPTIGFDTLQPRSNYHRTTAFHRGFSRKASRNWKIVEGTWHIASRKGHSLVFTLATATSGVCNLSTKLGCSQVWVQPPAANFKKQVSIGIWYQKKQRLQYIETRWCQPIPLWNLPFAIASWRIYSSIQDVKIELRSPAILSRTRVWMTFHLWIHPAKINTQPEAEGPG